MAESHRFFHFHLKWTPDRKIRICKGPGWLSRLFILSGAAEPDLPRRPLTKQEFYSLLSDLAAQGFMDNLLDF
ncbi:MAG: hypothetical protein ACJ8F7_04805 [Gemmataceae bacterium]